jgi:hypothetical protein
VTGSRGWWLCWRLLVRGVVAAGGRCVSAALVVRIVEWETYPLPSSLALLENIVAEMRIDAVIRIIVAVVGIACAEVYVDWTRNVGRRKSRSGWSGSS